MEKVQAVVFDFDKTLSRVDMADMLAAVVGKQQESEHLQELFHSGEMPGLEGLVARINFLKGMKVKDMAALIAEDDYLRPGARAVFSYCQENNITTIVASGNIVPFLELYRDTLGFDYVVGSSPQMENDTVLGIRESDYSSLAFKVDGVTAVLEECGIDPSALVAVGDSPADIGIFELAAVSIGVNPHERVADMVDHTVLDDLGHIIPILETLQVT